MLFISDLFSSRLQCVNSVHLVDSVEDRLVAGTGDLPCGSEGHRLSLVDMEDLPRWEWVDRQVLCAVVLTLAYFQRLTSFVFVRIWTGTANGNGRTSGYATTG